MIFKVFLLIWIIFPFTLEKAIKLPFKIVESQISEGEQRFLSEADQEIPVSVTSIHHLIIDLCVGSNKHCIKAKIATSYQYVWIADKEATEDGFDSEKSSTFSQTKDSVKLSELYGYVEGPICTDKIFVGNFRLQNFPFMLTSSNFKYDEYQGAIGFGYLYENEEYSLIDTLHKQYEIDNKVFYVKFNSEDEGYIKIGQYPKGARSTDKRFNYKTCDLLPETNDEERNPNPRWECSLKGIYYDNESGGVEYYEIDGRVSFNLAGNVLSTPTEFWDTFIMKYMKKYLDNEECKIEEMKFFRIVSCNKNFDYSRLGDFSYIIGKWSLKFKAQDLFRPLNGRLRFVVVAHRKLQTYNLGYDLYKKYTVVFDKYKSKVGILSEE